MSFGDDSGPIGGLVGGAIRQFDQVLAPAFGDVKPGKPKATPTSIVNQQANTPTAPAASADTPGRHKSLLGQ